MNRQCILSLAALLLAGAPAFAAAGSQTASTVKVWEQDTVIPTYLAGAPEPNPMFYFGRQSQGAEGRVYPYPLYDTLTNKKTDKTYKMVYLENEYIRIGVLPEVGGRIFEGVDKTNNYDFFYRQRVIKPALIGLIGAWISGGIEWNIPHHHRASTFIPVQYSVEENADGSKTVWVGELEVRHRMRWAVGYTLRPGKAFLEASLRILNRTPAVNTMLCFANVAVHANENYQVIFPPGTEYGTHHSKREFTTWPVSTGRYGGWDFSKGVDVSWFKNHVSANSIFAWNYEDDFLAGYDHGKQAGLMSVADHNVVPGKKLWTWGNGPRGRMWDHILTDQDGPYIELMVGAYSDNQPDYSWLQPYEVKSFSMNWYPFRDIGGVKNANLDAAVNLDVDKGTAKLGFYTTSARPEATVLLQAGGKVLFQEKISINPGKPYVKQVSVPAGIDQHDLRASISAGGKELVAYAPIRLEKKPMPKAVEPPPAPAEIKTTEELYLAGLRVEQFHDPNLDPDPYWEEALRRDPGDVRVNTALGINYFKKAKFAEAEKFLRKALERLTDKYTSPKDGEAIYYLGQVLKAQGRTEEAFTQFYKATWSLAWRAAGYYSLAEIAAARSDPAAALDLVERSIDANALNIRALNLKAALLRHAGRPKEALSVLATAHRKSDPLDVRSMAERWLAAKTPENAKVLASTMNAHPHTASETAAEYLNSGLWQDGTDVLLQAVAGAPDKTRIHAMVYYYLGYFAAQMGRQPQAVGYYRLAMKMLPEYVFPFQSEAIDVLRHAMKSNPNDARAPYYLGNLLFDWQPEQAVKLWEASAALDPSFPIVHRNLGIAWSHRPAGNSLDKAIASLEKAVSLQPKYPIHFAELDQLYETAGVAPEKRLALLESNQAVVARRDDAVNREVGLKVAMGKYDDAIGLMTGRRFAVWEGGNLNVAEYWMDAHLLRGRERLAAKRYREALADYQAAAKIPDNLPSERMGGRDAEVAYSLGTAYAALGDQERARQSWQKAAAASSEAQQSRRRGPGGLSPQGYYQALALGRLGQNDKAEATFRGLVDSANQALRQSPAETDSGASFEVLRAGRDRLATAHYVAGLGYLGLNDRDKARQEMAQALQASPDHPGVRAAIAGLGN
jgi:tetratricopeptide (TPR) repeat protein